jgi:hypothetical protein
MRDDARAAKNSRKLTQDGDCPDFCGRTPKKWDCPLPHDAQAFVQARARGLAIA